MPCLLSLHFINMWKPYTSEAGLPFIEYPARLSSQVVWYMLGIMTPLILLLAGLGLILTWRRRKDHLCVAYLIVAITVLENVAFYGSSRFRAPIEPLLVLLAGGMLWWCLGTGPGTLRALRRKQPTGDTVLKEVVRSQLLHDTESLNHSR
jgi:hypothetical protein